MPAVGDDDVLVRVLAVAVNHVDILIRSGRFDAGISFPCILGRDVVGIVENIGCRVKKFSPGQIVWSNCMGLHGRQGTCAEYCSIPKSLLFSLPEGAEVKAAAAALHSTLTAVVGIYDKAALRQGDTIFINGASGNVGRTVIELSRQIGAHIIATAGTPAKAERCRAAGADAVILYKETDIRQALHELAPDGVNVWWECSPTPDLELAIQSTGNEGRVILISGYTQRSGFKLGDMYPRNLSLYGFAVSTLDDDTIRRAAILINSTLANNVVHPRIAEILPLSATRLAHEKLENEPVDGKILLVPESTM
ncbi:MAG: zinc-binding dehydrogenase [bacterium]